MRYHLRMPIDMNALARLGAQARLAELAAEMDTIRRSFPSLGGSAVKKRGRPRRAAKQAPVQASVEPPASAADNTSASKPVHTQKRTMSAEARARISAAQKKRWAAQRKGKKR